MKILRYFFLLFCLVCPLFAQSNDESLRQIVKNFYTAFEKKDAENIKQFWKNDSPHLADFLNQTKKLFDENANLSVKNIKFHNSSFKDEIFRLRVSIEIQGKQQNLTFQFVKENNVWKIWRIRPSIDDFYFQIGNTESVTERENLFAKNQDLQTALSCDSAMNETRRLNTSGEFAKAINLLDFVENLSRRLDDKSCLARSLHRRGSIKYRQGEYREATKFLYESLELAQKLDDLPLQADVYVNLGLTLILQGNSTLCREYYNKSLVIAEKLNDKGRMARVLNNIANISDEPKISIPIFERVIKLSEETDAPFTAAYAIGNIGWAYSKLGDYEKAIEYMQKARERLEALDSQYDLIEAYAALGEFYFKQYKYQDALFWSEKSYRQTIKLGSQRDNSPSSLNRLFDIYRKMGNLNEARKAAEEAVSITEKFREKVSSDEYTQTRFLESRFQAYHNLILILSEMGEKENALAASEFYKGRVLWDVIRTGKTDFSKALNAEEREKEKQLRQDVSSLNLELTRENQKEYQNKPRLAELENKLKQARFALEEFQLRLYATKPELKIQRGEFTPIPFDEISVLFPDEQTAFLEFAVTDEKTFLYVITKENGKLSLEIYPIALKKEDLKKKADDFLAVISDDKINLDYKDKSRELYNVLLAAAREQLKGKTSLVVIPDSFLWEIPFQALMPTENRFLIEDFTVSYAPSLTVLREMNKSQSRLSKNPKLLAFGNPALNSPDIATIEKGRGGKLERLPSAEKEVDFLAKLYGAKQSTIYKNNRATETIFKANSKGFNILHFATHGILNNENPMYSALVLSLVDKSNEDGLLEAWELMEMNLDADLAVLSACETGRGDSSIGEGIVGLSWAFFVAGTPRMVASQWKVESASTAELMTEFHRQLRFAPNKTVAKTLQTAMLTQMKKPKFRHPFYWSGFISIGKN
ncbi:CHAT domain-containing protein [soil metagenome]